MTEDDLRLARITQEQVVAAWIDRLNQVRLDRLLEALRSQDVNLSQALDIIRSTQQMIREEIVERGRGGLTGMHGFIAELAEVGIVNGRHRSFGESPVYQWINDNGSADLLRDGVLIQQKFVMSDGRFGLNAIAEHLESYPRFLLDGGRYQIPRDQFETLQRLHDMPRAEAAKILARSSGGPTFTDWTRVHEFFDGAPLRIDDIEPSVLDYSEAQAGEYERTLTREEASLRDRDTTRRRDAYLESRPSLAEAAKVTAGSAAVEGGLAFVLAVLRQRRDGKKLVEFTQSDWQEIGVETAWATGKGAVRGVSIYGLTNFTATPAAVASGLVTASFGIAEQANRFRKGEIDEVDFIRNSERLSLQVSVSALSSFVGQVVIPVPVIGAVVGNTVGMVMYRVASSALSEREKALIEGYRAEQAELNEALAAEHGLLLGELEEAMFEYVDLLDRAFSPDVEAALTGSIRLAIELGVPTEEILDSEQKIAEYFLG